jgi:hypothetical protein
MKDRKIGEVLVHMGLVSSEQVENAVYEAKLNREKIGRVLIRLNLITPDALCRALALQSGLPIVDLASVVVPDTVRARFTDELMREYQFVPFDENPATLFIAISQPLDGHAIAIIRAHSRKPLAMFLAQEDVITLRLDEFQRLRARKHVRYPVSIPAQYQFCTRLGTPLEVNVYMVSTVNLSEGGVALQGAPQIPDAIEKIRRQDVYAQVLLKDSPNDIRSICQLRWVREKNPSAEDCMLGMEIVEISSGGRLKLQNLCQRASSSRRETAEQPPQTEAPKTQTLMQPGDVVPLSINEIRATLRSLGLLEEIVIHEQKYNQFMQERGIKEMGRGGESAVYFLRGHAVKVLNRAHSLAALREIAHLIHLNPLRKGGSMGERIRHDWPSLLWVYLLSNGSIAIGMKSFDPTEEAGGATLAQRLSKGPSMDRRRALETLCLIGDSIAYAHAHTILHHDLKPGNIFIPADARQSPVVFDLSQSLWKKSNWGREWATHEHNKPYIYNGTYRYMHAQRRMAYSGALALLQNRKLTPRQTRALELCKPSTYDDVFAFARIVRDVARSEHVSLSPDNRKALMRYARDLMGLADRPKRQVPAKELAEIRQTRLVKLTAIFKRPGPEVPAPAMPVPELKWTAMKGVVQQLYGILDEN